jgi:iron(III) transport system substrate-binding protein
MREDAQTVALRLRALLLVVVACALIGCDRREGTSSAPSTQPSSSPGASSQPLVLYTSVDEPYVKPILAEFESRTGIKVLAQTDTEATKSAGLAARLEAERDRPRADVWWGNEVFHTIRLAEAGVLAPYESPAAKDVPDKCKDAKEHRWAGTGLRVRMIAMRPGGDAEKSGPATLETLTLPALRGKVAIARPTAGTTGGHVSALYVLWGKDRFADYLKRLKANDVKMLGGNGPVAEAVGSGGLEAGLTDNDDVASVLRDGGRIVAFPPDQDTTGTLAIPTTVALVKGSQQPDAAKKLIDYLLSPQVEQKLIEVKFAGGSVRGDASAKLRTMDVDYAAAAHALPDAVKLAMTILEGRE